MSGAGAPEPAAHNVSACSLQNVSFSLSPGKVTALVGPSGSGKSSCVNVLENFYPLDGGRVLLDGRPVGAYDHKFLHRVVRGRLRPLLALPCLSFALAGCDRRRRAPQRVATGAAPPRSRGRAFQRPSSLPRAPPPRQQQQLPRLSRSPFSLAFPAFHRLRAPPRAAELRFRLVLNPSPAGVGARVPVRVLLLPLAMPRESSRLRPWFQSLRCVAGA